ncbi:MAG: hypothetical protein IKE52_02275 [Mogibacterium sp.]|nr:hypothetical protein [Mogibacterium sp.]
MAVFKIIEGRQSSLYNHFSEYELASCRATRTRLMGVVALKLTWRDAEDFRKRFYQIIHLDYSEYGIDEYLEFDCIPGNDDYAELREEVKLRWNHFIDIMGGEAVGITPSCMLRLVESALAYAGDDVEREYDNEENQDFRRYAIRRLDMMREVLESRDIKADDCDSLNAIAAVSAPNLGQYATINYFIMRLLDGDFEAAAFLTDIPMNELKNLPLAAHGAQTLMQNSIARVSKKDNPLAGDRLRMYNCRLTSLSKEGYYHTSLSIWLDGGMTSRDASIADIDIGSSILLSDFEAAFQVSQTEYITVFDCKDEMLDGFDIRRINMMGRADPTPCENGWLFTIYNETNSHVEKPEYRLNDDVYGFALLSLTGEFIVMSYDLIRISALDESILFSIYSPYVTVKGRYRLDNPTFHTFCHTAGLRFDDLVETDD